MRKYLALPLTVLAALSLGGCIIDHFDNDERFQTDFRYSYPLHSNATFTLENSNGTVEISGWDQDTVEITGVKFANTEALRDSVRIEINHTDTSISIRTVHPMEFHGNMGARYVIRVPRKVQLDRVVSTNGSIRTSNLEGAARLRTSNGAIHATRQTGDLEAQTTNGAIEVEDIEGSAHLHTSNGHVRADSVNGAIEASSTSGSIRIHEPSGPANGIRLTTSNGSIDLAVDGELKGDVHASTTNNSITLHLPAATKARVSAHTSHHDINTDFEVTRRGESERHSLEGALNGGGANSPMIDLSTTNGRIRVLKM